MNDAKQNPYVGPRTFRTDEGGLFFGREREALDLLSLVISERLVLFYAQSGVGKSSLVNTRLIPGLNAEGEYEVLPIGRVKGDHEGLEINNIYVFNLISSLAHYSINEDVLSKLTLSEFLSKLDISKEGYFYNEALSHGFSENEDSIVRKYVLIIDQFEELFTTHHEAWEKREDFFKQLTQAMQDIPHLWIVLVMREDYIAYLDPYSHFLPGRLRVRYYMQRLERDAALEAIKNPVKDVRPYAVGVAEELVENLAGIKVQKPGGEQSVQAGQFVEPVQLQVVCHNLWEHLSEGSWITLKDLQDVGDVDQALERYYDERVSLVAKNEKVSEREIRDWFDKELITSNGTRNMVLRNPNSSTGLSDDVIQTILGDLVRAELRAGQIWYELSHDRLIEPVRKSNAKWFEEHLSLFQRQVILWLQQGRSDSLLVRDPELQAAEREAEILELTEDEMAFLEACRNLRRRARRDQAQRRRIVAALVTSVILLLAAVFSTVRANQATKLAEEQAQRATTYAALFLAKSQRLDTALLVTSQAYLGWDHYQTRGTLLDIVQTSPHLRQWLFGHSNSVVSVGFSPDGKTLASGSKDHTIILWDVATHKPIGKPLAGHHGYVQSVAFSPNGQTLASAGDDDSIILWDLTTSPPTGQPFTGQGHSDSIYSIAFSPDGRMLASGSWDDTIILWDTATRKPIGEPLTGHQDDVYSVAFSPDGKILASGSLDRTIILWDVATHQSIGQTLNANAGFVENVVFSPDGKILASASFNGIITLWDVVTRLQLGSLKGHTNWVSSLAFAPDGKTLASASADGTIILWDVTTRQAKDKPLTGHNGTVHSVAFSPDGNSLASAGLDRSVILWDVIARQAISQFLGGHEKPINSVAFSPDGEFLASGSDDFNFILWDLSKRQSMGLPHPDVGQSVTAVTFSPDGKVLALAGFSTGIFLWDIASEKSKGLLVGNKTYDYVYSLAFSPDGKTLASGNWEDTIILWDVVTEKQIDKPFKGHEPTNDAIGLRFAVRSLAFSPDGKLLASGSEDKTIILWDTATYQSVGQLEGHTGPVYCVTFSPDGRLLASASSDGTIVLWDAKTRQSIQQLSGHISSVQSLAFTPDGTLASGSTDKTIILWDIAARQRIGQALTGHSGSVYSLVFSPDGKTLISASKEIIVWDLDPRSWVEKSCQRAGRNLTLAEWVQYFPNQTYRAICPQWPLESEMISTATP